MLIVGLVAAMAAAAGADEKPLWTANFAEGGNVFVMRHVKREVVSADQIRFPDRCSHVEVREFPAFEGAVRLSFKARYLNRNEHNPMQFIDLVTTSGAVFHYIMYNQNGISHSVKTALAQPGNHDKIFSTSVFTVLMGGPRMECGALAFRNVQLEDLDR